MPTVLPNVCHCLRKINKYSLFHSFFLSSTQLSAIVYGEESMLCASLKRVVETSPKKMFLAFSVKTHISFIRSMSIKNEDKRIFLHLSVSSCSQYSWFPKFDSKTKYFEFWCQNIVISENDYLQCFLWPFLILAIGKIKYFTLFGRRSYVQYNMIRK